MRTDSFHISRRPLKSRTEVFKSGIPFDFLKIYILSVLEKIVILPHERGKVAQTCDVETNQKTKKKSEFSKNLQENIDAVKAILTAEDIFLFEFCCADKTAATVIYADGITDKELLGTLAARPLAQKNAPKTLEEAQKSLLFPETKTAQSLQQVCDEILSGNPALFIDSIPGAVILGTKKISLRAVMEPQTSITVKGPREGFIEDVKTNMGLIRKRLKSPALQFETLQVGRVSQSVVVIAYLDNIADKKIVKEVRKRIQAIDIDGIPDSSYIGQFLAKKPYSLFKQIGSTEKPDILCAKMLEGRIAILVDGSPIALTLPYLLSEDFQSPQDYFVSPYRATISRILRLFAVLVSLYLPSFYIAAQLFKLQLLPFGLLMTVSGGIQDIPLSPSLELFFLLVVLEILIEASVRMPKYVALALSVIGALVLGDTAVKAGLVSSPAIIIVALSGISAYTVPDLTGTLSVIRIAFIVVAGSIGTYGILLLTALILWYLISSDSYGTPLLAPFSPLIPKDLSDSLWKTDIYDLNTRPAVLRGKNKFRLKIKNRGN